tara:strand:- start:778 stop:1608 length:831 start_codon:yes stop_codon:yes gene_type:complete
MKSQLLLIDKKWVRCSENSIQAIVIAQDLARSEKIEFVELHHILGGLKQNKKSYAANLLSKFNIDAHENHCNSNHINNSLKKSSFNEIPLSESVRNIIQKAIRKSVNNIKSGSYLRSIFILKAILLNPPENINSSYKDIYENKNVILNKLIDIEKIKHDLLDDNDLDFENILQSEKEILGMIMHNSEVIHKIINVLKPEYFYYRKHDDIYRSALILHNQKKSINFFEISKYLLRIGMLEKIGGDNYLIEIANSSSCISSFDEKIKNIEQRFLIKRN